MTRGRGPAGARDHWPDRSVPVTVDPNACSMVDPPGTRCQGAPPGLTPPPGSHRGGPGRASLSAHARRRTPARNRRRRAPRPTPATPPPPPAAGALPEGAAPAVRQGESGARPAVWWYVLGAVGVLLVAVGDHAGGHLGPQDGHGQGPGGAHHHHAPAPVAHLPADRHAGARRHGAGPSRPGRQDRQLPRRPAVGRPQPGRHRLRGAGGGGHHPPGGRLPVPGGPAGRRPPLGPRARRRHPVAAVQPAVRPRRRHRPRHRPAAGRRRSRTTNLYSGTTGRPSSCSPAGSRPTRPSSTPPRSGPSSPPTSPPRRRSSSSRAPRHRLGAGLRGQRPHPVLVELGRHLDLEPVERGPTSGATPARPTRCSPAGRRRRRTWWS